VLDAGRHLLDALDQEDLEAMDYAVTRLEAASDAQAASAESYRRFMFSETERGAQPQQEVVKESAMEDVFASVLTDLQVGNVLLAAGQTMGEGGQTPRPEYLTDALGRLENTTATIEAAGGGDGARRFNFAEDAEQPSIVKSSTAEEAVESYRQRASETLEAVVNEAYSVAVSVVEALRALDPSAVLRALEGLGGPIKAAAGFVARLINKGIEKIKSAVKALVNFVGNDAVAKIKDKLVELWKKVGQEDFARSALASVLGVNETREAVRQKLDAGNLDRDSLDEGSNALGLLAARYKNNMAMARKSVSAITFASSIVAFTPIGPHNAALMAGVGYGTVLAVVILLGMDYADSGRVLRLVRGVGEVTNGLRSGNAAAPSA
jgi:hypothetical protein